MTRATLCECIEKGNRVRFDNSEYIPTHYILSIKAGKWQHSAVLKDIKHFNSVVIADLERIELIV